MNNLSDLEFYFFKSSLDYWDCEYLVPSFRTYQFAMLQAEIFTDGDDDDKFKFGSSDIFHIIENYTEDSALNYAEYNIYESKRLLSFYPEDDIYNHIAENANFLKLLIINELYDKIHHPISRLDSSLFSLSLRYGGNEINSIGRDINLIRMYELKRTSVVHEKLLSDINSRQEDAYNKTIFKRANILNDLSLFVKEKSLDLWKRDEFKDFRTGDMTNEIYEFIMSSKSHYEKDEKLIPTSKDWYRKIITKVAPPHAKRPGRAKK